MIFSVTRWSKTNQSSLSMPSSADLQKAVQSNNSLLTVPANKFNKTLFQNFVSSRLALQSAYLEHESSPNNYRVTSADGSTVYSILEFSSEANYSSYEAFVSQTGSLDSYKLVREQLAALFGLSFETQLVVAEAVDGVLSLEQLESQFNGTPISG